MTALFQNPELSKELLRFEAFTDIAFNPQKSLNCQARAAARFCFLEYVWKNKPYGIEKNTFQTAFVSR